MSHNLLCVHFIQSSQLDSRREKNISLLFQTSFVNMKNTDNAMIRPRTYIFRYFQQFIHVSSVCVSVAVMAFREWINWDNLNRIFLRQATFFLQIHMGSHESRTLLVTRVIRFFSSQNERKNNKCSEGKKILNCSVYLRSRFTAAIQHVSSSFSQVGKRVIMCLFGAVSKMEYNWVFLCVCVVILWNFFSYFSGGFRAI